MATIPVKHKRSATPGKVPTTAQLPLGEIAINTFDGKAYLKKNDGTESIVELGSAGGYTAPKAIVLYNKDGSGSTASFDGIETRFQIRDDNGGIPAILTALTLSVSVNGVVQKPNEGEPVTFEGFYITPNGTAGSDIVFSDAPATGADFFGILGGMFAATGGTSAITYIDDISASFDGVTTDFTLQVNGSNYAPDYSVGVLVTLGGVVQIPTDSYSISGSTISFTQAPPTGTSFHAVDFRLGPSADMAAAIITASDTPPEDPADGQLWYDSVGGRVYLWYNDGTTSQWVDAAPATIGGTIELDGGNGASPSLTFAADTDTGVYSATANTLGFATGGSGRMVIDANGRIGVGNASPDTIVHITDAATPKLQVEDTTNNVKTSIGSDDSVGRVGTDTNHPLTLRVNDVERMHIDNQGRVGIGTASPAQNLHIRQSADGYGLRVENGAVGLLTGGSSSPSRNVIIAGARVDSGSFPTLQVEGQGGTIFSVAGTERARIDSSGRLLVGTASTTKTLTQVVQGNSADSTGNAVLALAIGRTNPNTGFIGQLQFTNSSHNMGARIYAEGATNWTDGTSHPANLVFSTCASGASSPTEQLRITSDRYVRLASGAGGIQFNGDTAAANALDDYEEGTWTPVLDVNGSNASTTVVLSGKYLKIGNAIWLYLFMYQTSTGPTDWSVGWSVVSGTPFAGRRFAIQSAHGNGNLSGTFPRIQVYWTGGQNMQDGKLEFKASANTGTYDGYFQTALVFCSILN